MENLIFWLILMVLQVKLALVGSKLVIGAILQAASPRAQLAEARRSGVGREA